MSHLPFAPSRSTPPTLVIQPGSLTAGIRLVAASSACVLALALFAPHRADHQQAAVLSGMAQSVDYFIAGVRPLVFGANTAQRWRGPAALLIARVLLQIAFGYVSGGTKNVHEKLPPA